MCMQKGTAKFVSSGSIYALSQVATNIRAEWMIGQIQDMYLKFESAGDHYISHIILGLPICCLKFVLLPPCFDCCVNNGDGIAKIVC